jgi:hypothetical protein
MKSKFKTTLLALTGVGLFANPAMAAVTTESGSLAVAFYQVIGGVVQSNTYIYDLGQASNYRENTAIGVSVSTISGGPANNNISGDLTAAFGANWANDGTVRWMVIGNVGSADPTVGGDPARTNYYSRAVSTIQPGVSTTIPSISSTNRGILSNNLESVFDNVVGETSGNNADGAIINIADPGTINEFLPPSTLTYFGIGINPYQTLSAGTINNNTGSQVGPVEGALDIYRILHTTTDADLTAGLSSGNATVGQGQYIGTLVLTSSGGLYVIPEPSSALLGVAGALGLCLRRRRIS